MTHRFERAFTRSFRSVLACASALALLGAAGTSDERFAVDLEARTVTIRQQSAAVPLIGIEPILGTRDGDFGKTEILTFLAKIPADEKLLIEPAEGEERGDRPRRVFVHRADGGLLNEQLLDAGLVRAITAEPYPKRDRFVRAESVARAKHVGLWGYFEPREAAARLEGNHRVYRILYATDRVITNRAKPDEAFGTERGAPTLSYGSCDVSIPRDHKMGQLERPSVWSFQFREDPDKHVVLLKVEHADKDAFFADLAHQVGQSAARAALVFVHGFNVDFAEAARRTAQLAYDLSFDGAPILYSWPSRGSLTDYVVDSGTADWSAEHLKGFLEDVARTSGVKTVHLIAHSMGNRVLTQALRNFAAVGPDGQPLRFNQVVLTAPDIDAQTFREQIVPAIRGRAERITLYASSNDEALKASKKLWDARRAGDTGKDVVVVDGIDTIDVSSIDSSFLGHSYFAENRSVITDLRALLLERKAPSDRKKLVGVPSGAPTYWQFQD